MNAESLIRIINLKSLLTLFVFIIHFCAYALPSARDTLSEGQESKASKKQGKDRPRIPAVISQPELDSISTEETCRSKSENISLEFFSSLITDTKVDGTINLLKFDDKNGEIVLVIPEYNNSCIDLDLDIQKVASHGQKQFLRLLLKNKNTELNQYDGNTLEEKLVDCLRKKEILINNSSDQEIFNKEKLKASTSEQKKKSIKLAKYNLDQEKPFGILFGSPKSSDSVISKTSASNDDWCFMDEHIGDEFTSLRDNQKANDNRIVNLCQSLNLDEIQRELENDALKPYQQSLLNNVLRQAQEKFAYDTLSEMDRVGKEILKSDNKGEIKLLGDQYRELAKRYDREIIQDGIEELKIQGDNLRNASNADQAKMATNEIRRISSLVGSLSDTSNSKIFPQVLDKFLENGLDEHANDVALVGIKSNEYSKDDRFISALANERLNKKTTSSLLRDIDKEIVQDLHDKYKSRSKEAKIVYEEKTGQTRLSPSIKEEMDELIRKRDSQFQARINSINQELQKCNKNVFGFMIHPISCKNAINNKDIWYREALSKKGEYNQQINELAVKYKRYVGYEKEAQKNEKKSSGGKETNEKEDNKFLGTYGLFGNYGGSSSESSEVYNLEHADLANRSFNIGNDPMYQSYFSNPSRMDPYANFKQNQQTGYSFMPF